MWPVTNASHSKKNVNLSLVEIDVSAKETSEGEKNISPVELYQIYNLDMLVPAVSLPFTLIQTAVVLLIQEQLN